MGPRWYVPFEFSPASLTKDVPMVYTVGTYVFQSSLCGYKFLTLNQKSVRSSRTSGTIGNTGLNKITELRLLVISPASEVGLS